MVSLNKRGIPTLLSSIQVLLDGSKWDKRFLLTQLNISRCLDYINEPNFSSVTDETVTANKTLFRRIVLKAKGLRTSQPKWTAPHQTTKAGPNGPALASSQYDLSILPQWLSTDIATLGGDKLESYKKSLAPLALLRDHKQDRNLLRRLSIVNDPEGKARVIAILDYWSQTALKPLHDQLLEMQKTFKADCTFDQGSRQGRITANQNFHSLDLTAATDRFPATLQRDVLSEIFGSEIGEAWYRIMVKQPFDYKGQKYSYATGQPMGAYSSWATFALCHHLVVQLAADKAGHKGNYTNYMQLGDDVVLGDDDVAFNYTTIMRELGVGINASKTHVSKDTYEFAKRWVHRGEEISPAPLRSLRNIEVDFSCFNTFYNEIVDRWSISWSLNPGTIRSKIAQILPKAKVHLAVKRIWESSILPLPEESPENISYKTDQVNKTLLKGHLGCNASQKQKRFVKNLLWNAVRMKSYQEHTIKTFKLIRDYLSQEESKMSDKKESFGGACHVPMPDSRNLPVCWVSRNFLKDLQMMIDGIRASQERNIEVDEFGKAKNEASVSSDLLLGINPFEVDSRRRDQILQYVRSKVPKGIKSYIRQHREKRTRTD